MADTLDFRVKIIDQATREMENIRRMTSKNLGRMSNEQKKYTKEVHNTELQILKLNRESVRASKVRQKEIRNEISDLKKLQAQQKKGLSVANREKSGGLAGTISAGIKSSGIGAGIGGLGLIANPATAITGGLAAAGYGIVSQINQVEPILNKWRILVQGTEEDYLKLTNQTRVIADVFQQDFNQVIRSANTLSKEMGISASKALSLISKGFEVGANVSGEFLNQLREYPSQLAKVGINASETIAIISETERMGIFSDKGIDSIKEAGLRLAKNNKTTQESLKPLGESVNLEIRRNIELGKTFKAIQIISKEMFDQKLTANQLQLITENVFGAPGEDAGNKYLQSLQKINIELSTMESKLTDTQKAKNKFTSAWSSFTTELATSFTPFWTKFLNVGANILRGFTPSIGRSDRVQQLIDQYNKGDRAALSKRAEFLQTGIERQKKLRETATGEEFVRSTQMITNLEKELAEVVAARKDIIKEERQAIINKYKNDKEDEELELTDDLSPNKTSTTSATELSKRRDLKSITINISKLTGVETLSTTNIQESSSIIGETIKKELIKVITDASAFKQYK